MVHVAGKFHVEQGLGTKASILKRNPDLKVVVITPSASMSEDLGQDYRLLVLEPPVRYVQLENKMEAYRNLGNRNEELTCR